MYIHVITCKSRNSCVRLICAYSCEVVQRTQIKSHGIIPLCNYCNMCSAQQLQSVKEVHSLIMSLLRYFAKAKEVPTAEETGIMEKPIAEAKKCVAEVLEQQRLGQFTGVSVGLQCTWSSFDQFQQGGIRSRPFFRFTLEIYSVPVIQYMHGILGTKLPVPHLAL